jgi:hypothetical protein
MAAPCWNPFPFPVLTSAGAVASGAKAYFYAVGTTTPITVYTNYGLTVAHSSPVVADAYGVFAEVYIPGTTDYKVRVTDADGNLIFEADGIKNTDPTLDATTLTGSITFRDDGEGVIFSKGGKMFDPDANSTKILANNNVLDIRNEADSSSILNIANGTVTGATFIATSTVELANGSAGTPALRFTNDGNSGLYSVSDGVLGLSLDGTLRVTFQPTSLAFASSVTVLQFSGDADLQRGTADGSDTGSLSFSGGGGAGSSRGGHLIAYGNEHATHAGDIKLTAGSTGSVDLIGTTAITGAATVSSTLNVTSVISSQGTADATTGNAANLWINSAGGNMARSTSSGKYKRDVEEIWAAKADLIFQMRPVWYRSTADTIDDPTKSFYGLIAEEVAKIEPRLVHWGEDGPEGVQYERLTVLLIDIVKRQEARIAALEARG